MKKNLYEKSLIKVDNSIFNKIKQFFRKLFKSNHYEKNINNNKDKKQSDTSLKINFVKDIKVDLSLQKLQENFENKKILEKDLSKEELQELRKLYLQQIKEKKQSIENYKNKIKKIHSQLS